MVQQTQQAPLLGCLVIRVLATNKSFRFEKPVMADPKKYLVATEVLNTSFQAFH